MMQWESSILYIDIRRFKEQNVKLIHLVVMRFSRKLCRTLYLSVLGFKAG